ncbi:hypothetical protein PISMIDRAFT_679792 [Pisolithus microcarpus 441]|uniref:Uncharacterized protein n=2 Tax=Pisolithus microcarpus 441 TaxID=765257 RepID=A0A0C9Z9Y9_9AGAM|nr:hypothetical protein BKA83DRAFT_679792 [Pisolithus microcarpus]KIK22804.1 hypothetical protein PISMIDRAFT_679792 [Pisolithus microcarpus 441]
MSTVTVVRYTIQKPPSTGNGALKSQRHGLGLREIQGMCHHGTTQWVGGKRRSLNDNS